MHRIPLYIFLIIFFSSSVVIPKVQAQGNASVKIAGGYPHDDPKDSVYLYWTALQYEYVCWSCALDTMRMYCEQHPYATHYPGEVLDGIAGTYAYSSNRMPLSRVQEIDNFNWYVKMQPVNMERAYQQNILEVMGNALGQIDLNESANLWYNYSLLFPDSASSAYAWAAIRSIRRYQKNIPQDTTPFYKLTFPLKPHDGGSSAVRNAVPTAGFELSISPNPASDAATITYGLPKLTIIKLSLYDVLGREVKTVSSGSQDAGVHTIAIAVGDVSPGQYYLRMEYPSGVMTQKLMIAR